ncbi:MAG: hypothetical protein ACXVP5_12275 [Tumebacillaceae bacterium]
MASTTRAAANVTRAMLRGDARRYFMVHPPFLTNCIGPINSLLALKLDHRDDALGLVANGKSRKKSGAPARISTVRPYAS